MALLKIFMIAQMDSGIKPLKGRIKSGDIILISEGQEIMGLSLLFHITIF